jgi:hypothetical protein
MGLKEFREFLPQILSNGSFGVSGVGTSDSPTTMLDTRCKMNVLHYSGGVKIQS